MKKALTNRTLESLKTTGERYAVHDAHCPGLVVRVNASGTKTFAVVYRYGIKQRRLTLGPYPIGKIVSTYQHRTEEARYSRRVSMAEIEENDFNLNISRYVSTATAEEEIDLARVNASLVDIDKRVKAETAEHNKFLSELGLPLLPL